MSCEIEFDAIDTQSHKGKRRPAGARNSEILPKKGPLHGFPARRRPACPGGTMFSNHHRDNPVEAAHHARRGDHQRGQTSPQQTAGNKHKRARLGEGRGFEDPAVAAPVPSKKPSFASHFDAETG